MDNDIWIGERTADSRISVTKVPLTFGVCVVGHVDVTLQEVFSVGPPSPLSHWFFTHQINTPRDARSRLGIVISISFPEGTFVTAMRDSGVLSPIRIWIGERTPESRISVTKVPLKF